MVKAGLRLLFPSVVEQFLGQLLVLVQLVAVRLDPSFTLIPPKFQLLKECAIISTLTRMLLSTSVTLDRSFLENNPPMPA